MKIIRVNAKSRSYNIAVSDNLSGLSAHLKGLKLGRVACCITNKKLRALFAVPLARAVRKAGLAINFIEIPDTEKSKSLFQSERIVNEVLRYDRKERPFIAALGGGVVGDLAGYVASIYKRGIPYIQLPTTLLSQVDSAIGGKVGVDLPCAKNLVGSFYQPHLVYISADALRTLPIRQIRNGLAEVVKYGVIKDERLFSYLEKNYGRALEGDMDILKNIVYRSARIKARLVELDERDETGARIILNFGHTIGHAIEQATGYSRKICHGEAISMGMAVASSISVRLKLLERDTAARIKALLANIGLPVRLSGLSIFALMKAYQFDKKFIHGTNRIVLPVRLGRAIVKEDIPNSTIIGAIEENSRMW